MEQVLHAVVANKGLAGPVTRKRKYPFEDPNDVNPEDLKPQPCGQPKAWGKTRQQMCETLPWYRAYQSSAYSKNGVVFGFLVDKEFGPRDVFDDQIIITSMYVFPP